ETVCCAGVTADGHWKRLFPIRFRHLSGSASFKRWDWVEFNYRTPTRDKRTESCHVNEESIRVVGSLRPNERSRLLEPMIVGSGLAAAANGRSLALIRPRNTWFYCRRKSPSDVEAERDAFRRSANQTSLFDKELAEIEPSPIQFRFRFEDDAGPHEYECGDW